MIIMKKTKKDSNSIGIKMKILLGIGMV
jgi:hypothetical protein